MDAAEIRNALSMVAHILTLGERSHPADSNDHWLNLSARDHVRRGLAHADKALVSARSGEDDLGHAPVRFLLALEQRERSRNAATNLQATNQGRRAR